MKENKGIIVVEYDDLKKALSIENFDIIHISKSEYGDRIEILVKGKDFPFEYKFGENYSKLHFRSLKKISRWRWSNET